MAKGLSVCVEFHQCVVIDIHGLLPELLLSVGLLRVLRFPPTTIRQMDNRQGHLNWKGLSALEIMRYKRRITIN